MTSRPRTPLPPIPQPRRPTVSLLTRLANYPSDLFWRIAEEWSALDVVDEAAAIRYPAAAVLNALFLFCCLYRMEPTCDCEDPLGLAGKAVEGGWDRTATDAVFYVLWAISLLNAVVFLLNCHKKRFFQHALKDVPFKSPNVRRKSISRPSSREEVRHDADSVSTPLRALWGTMTDVMQSARRRNTSRQTPPPAQPKADEIIGYELSVWDPPELYVTLFSFFSPAQLLLLSSISASTWPYLILIAGTLAFQTHHLATLYTQRCIDECILRDQVMNEYNAKFVYPRTLHVRADASTMTEPLEGTVTGVTPMAGVTPMGGVRAMATATPVAGVTPMRDYTFTPATPMRGDPIYGSHSHSGWPNAQPSGSAMPRTDGWANLYPLR
ncbi:hypothetical protein M427DRAFT_46980 [Gonapodya prolifera JEL478]|uniref:Nuclear rim protein 1 n=1 Tax=Gonapodya prolifera (strain JEL478) TaxID=1344416 RepID=A0A139A4Q5_GONPJ|nr:hypothetical protein M427DRAFT_46980 [Gonapodya prolifera JEL478]|eukprot:KXS11598.1 hypothetical protein M427DRAFT_46980 [Gonapodya prolifera JEL478]